MVLPADSPLSLVRTTAHLTFRGTHGGAEGNQHSAVPLASTRQGAGVRLAIQEGTDVSGLALAREAVPRHLQSPPLGRDPRRKLLPKAQGRTAGLPRSPGACPGANTQQAVAGHSDCPQPLEASAKRWGDPRLSPPGSADGWKAESPPGLRHTGVQTRPCSWHPGTLASPPPPPQAP